MSVTRRLKRDVMGGADWQLPVMAGRTVRQGAQFQLGPTTVSVSGGRNLQLLGERCDVGRVLVNFNDQDRLLGTKWLAQDFTGAIRLAFDPPVAGFGTQFAADANMPMAFTALLRVVLVDNTVQTFENPSGQTTATINGSAAFLGTAATNGERISVALLDVREQGGTGPRAMFVNWLRVEP